MELTDIVAIVRPPTPSPTIKNLSIRQEALKGARASTLDQGTWKGCCLYYFERGRRRRRRREFNQRSWGEEIIAGYMLFIGIHNLSLSVTRGYGDHSLTTAATLEWQRGSDRDGATGAAAARRGLREELQVSLVELEDGRPPDAMRDGRERDF